MKHRRSLILLVTLTAILLSAINVSAVSTVTVSSAKIGFNQSIVLARYLTVDGTTRYVQLNITLPCNIADLDGTGTYITLQNNATGATSYNITVNGVQVNDTSVMAAGALNVSSLSYWHSKGAIGNTSRYLNINVSNNATQSATGVNSNATGYINITIAAEDATMRGESYFYYPKQLTAAWIKTTKGAARYTVNDTINITNPSSYINLTYCNLTLSYPNYGVLTMTKDSGWNFSYGDYLNITPTMGGVPANGYYNGSENVTVQYVKQGPYITKFWDVETGTQYQAQFTVTAIEEINYSATKNEPGVKWNIDISDDTFSDYFPRFNWDDYTVEFNGHTVKSSDISDDEDNTLIKIRDQDLEKGPNRLVFTWTPTAEAVTPSGGGYTVPSYLQFFGWEPTSDEPIPWYLEWWGLTLIAAIIICVIALVILAYRKGH